MKYVNCVALCGILAAAACSSSSGDLADARIVAVDANGTARADAHVVVPDGESPDATVVPMAGSVAITSGPSGYFTTDPAPSFDFELTGGVVSVTCSVDQDVASACTTPYLPGTLADGDHTVTVAIVDQLDGASSDSRSFTIDTSPEPIWASVTPATSPGPRSAQAMVYDELHHQVVMFGGSTDGNGDLATDTWTWDGNAWTLHSTLHSPPGAWSPAMAYDSTNQNVVMISGDSGTGAGGLNETWIWDGNDWTQAQHVHAPAGRINSAMANDPIRGLVVLFGGAINNVNQNDTWIWDGTDWTQLTPADSPPARCLHQMAYDGHNIVVNGGNGLSAGFLDDTWTFDGTTWSQPTTVFTPPARWMSVLIYDSVRDRLLLFGGLDSSENPLADTWEWNGSQWRQRTPLAAPSGRWEDSVAYDEVNQQIVLYAGASAAGYLSDTWLLQ